MKILQIIPDLSEGGAERFVVDLSNELVKKAKVTVVCFFENKDSFLKTELNDEIILIELDKKLGFDISLFKKLKTIINSFKPDVIHTHIGSIKYILPYALKKNSIKFFHTVHNDALKEASFMFRKINSLFYKTNRIQPITISDNSDLSFKEVYKTSAEKIYNGRKPFKRSSKYLEAKKFIENLSKNKEYKVLVNIARISPQKNHVLLIKSFKQLIKEGLKIKLIIIGGARFGDEEYFDEVTSLEDVNVHFLGVKNNPVDYLEFSDAFCLSSKYEGLPITLLEAFSVGCIPICTPVGGIPQLVKSGHTGYLSKSIAVQDYTNAIKNWYKDSDENHEKIRSQCKEVFNEEFSIESCSTAYLKLFEKSLATK